LAISGICDVEVVAKRADLRRVAVERVAREVEPEGLALALEPVDEVPRLHLGVAAGGLQRLGHAEEAHLPAGALLGGALAALQRLVDGGHALRARSAGALEGVVEGAAGDHRLDDALVHPPRVDARGEVEEVDEGSRPRASR
jgi:hypothetical protein